MRLHAKLLKQFKVIWPVQSRFQKESAFGFAQIKSRTSWSRTRKEGRLAIVTDVGSGMRWTHIAERNSFARTNGVCADGEVVWSWRPDAGAKSCGTCPARRRWQESPVTGESAKDTVKTIAQGMPDDSGVPVVANACAFFVAHAASGATRIRHSLRPLCFSRVVRSDNSDTSVPRERRLVSAIMLRPILRDAAFAAPQDKVSPVVRSQTLVVRRRASAVSNHEARL